MATEETIRSPRRGLLIFDLDGTLFRGDRGTVRAVWETCDRFGLPRPGAEEINGYFGRPVHEFHDWFRAMAPGRDMTAFLEEMDRREFELVAETGELYPGVREMLERFREEFRLAICSNGSKIYIDTVLKSRGIDGLFDLVRHRKSPGENKTEMAREILAELRSHFSDRMFKTVVNFNTKIKEAASYGQPVNEYDPASKGHQDFGRWRRR